MPERRWRYRRGWTELCECSTRGHYPYTGSAATSECPAELQRGLPAHYSYPASGPQRRWQPPEKQAGTTEAVSVDGHADAPNSGCRVRKAAIISRRKPTPRQRARWKAVQRAKLNGLSIRGIARELGIHRDTVRRYMAAESPPMMRPRVKSGASQSDTMTNYSDGYIR